jgi:hypothetical protein
VADWGTAPSTSERGPGVRAVTVAPSTSGRGRGGEGRDCSSLYLWERAGGEGRDCSSLYLWERAGSEGQVQSGVDQDAGIHDALGVEHAAGGSIRLGEQRRPLEVVPGTVIATDGVVVGDRSAAGDQCI